jgi:hypothetical protein
VKHSPPTLATRSSKRLRRRVRFGGARQGPQPAWLPTMLFKLGRGEAAWATLARLPTPSASRTVGGGAATAATRPVRRRAGAAARGITAATGPAGMAPNSSKIPLQIGYDRTTEFTNPTRFRTHRTTTPSTRSSSRPIVRPGAGDRAPARRLGTPQPNTAGGAWRRCHRRQVATCTRVQGLRAARAALSRSKLQSPDLS